MATGVVQPQLMARPYTQTNAQVLIVSLFLSQEQQHKATGCVLIVYLLCSLCAEKPWKSLGRVSATVVMLVLCLPYCVGLSVPVHACEEVGGGGLESSDS